MPPVISQSRAGVLRHPECWTVEIKGHSPATNVLGKRGSYERTGFASHPSMGEERSGVMAKRNGCFPVLVARYCVPSAVRKTVVSEGSNEKVGRMSRTYLGSRWPSSGRSAITRRRPPEGHMRPLALSYGPLDRLDASVAADAGGLRGLV